MTRRSSAAPSSAAPTGAAGGPGTGKRRSRGGHGGPHLHTVPTGGAGTRTLKLRMQAFINSGLNAASDIARSIFRALEPIFVWVMGAVGLYDFFGVLAGSGQSIWLLSPGVIACMGLTLMAARYSLGFKPGTIPTLVLGAISALVFQSWAVNWADTFLPYVISYGWIAAVVVGVVWLIRTRAPRS